MTLLTVTAKGQVTLRKEVLEHLGVRPGDKIAVEMLPCGRVQVSASVPSGHISDVFDLLKQEGRPALSIEDMNKIAASGWAGQR